jgi:hypothetical protein
MVNVKINAQSQVITTTGTGTSYEMARNRALTYAIESAFGTFISSETKISNDILQSDEIYAISNGNISKITEVSKIQIGDNYSVTLNVSVEPRKLASFVKSHGIDVEFKGEDFSSKLKTIITVEKMNEENELHIINNLVLFSKLVLPKCFNYEVKASEPYLSILGNWNVKIQLNIVANKNLKTLIEYLQSNLPNAYMSSGDRSYIGKKTYKLYFNGMQYYMRTTQSINMILNFFSHDLFNEITKTKILMDSGSNSKEFSLQPVIMEHQRESLNYFFTYELPYGDKLKLIDKDYTDVNNGHTIVTQKGFNSLKIKERIDGNELVKEINIIPTGDFAEFGSTQSFPNNETGINIIGSLKGFKVLK